MGLAIDTAKFATDDAFGDRTIVGIKQAVLRPLDANEVPGFSGKLEGAAHSHGRIGMKEAERTLCSHPEQQIEKSRESGRFSRFVRTIDDVQVGKALWFLTEVDALIGEVSKASQIEAFEAHELCILFECMKPRENIFSALSRQNRKTSLEGCLVRAEAVAAFLWKLRSQFVGDCDELRLKALRVKHLLLDEASQLHERVGRGPGCLNGGLGCHFELFGPALTDAGSTGIPLR